MGNYFIQLIFYILLIFNINDDILKLLIFFTLQENYKPSYVSHY